MGEIRPGVILISLTFVWSVQPGCLSLSCRIIITPTDVFDQMYLADNHDYIHL